MDWEGGGGVQQCHGDRLGKNPPPPRPGSRAQGPADDRGLVACVLSRRSDSGAACNWRAVGAAEATPETLSPRHAQGGGGARGRKVHSPSGETVGGIILGGVWRFYRWPKRSFKAEMII